MHHRAFLLLSAVLLATGCTTPAPPPALLIGHVADDNDGGPAAQRGIRLAVEEANKEATRPVKVLHANPRGKLEAFEAEAVRLVAVNRVQALLGGVTLDELERLDRARTVIVSPCGLRSAALSDGVFCTGLAPAFVGETLVKFAKDELKLNKIAIVVDERREEYRQAADAARRALGEPPLTTSYGKDAKFDELAKRIRAAQPDAVLVAASAADARQWRQALGEPALPLLFAGDEGGLTLLQREPETRSGVYLATAFVADGGTERMKEFAAKYARAFQENPDAHAALAHDNAQLLFAALRRVSTGGTLRDEVAATREFASLSGPLSFGKDQCARRPAFVVRLEDGKAATVRRHDPAQE